MDAMIFQMLASLFWPCNAMGEDAEPKLREVDIQNLVQRLITTSRSANLCCIPHLDFSISTGRRFGQILAPALEDASCAIRQESRESFSDPLGFRGAFSNSGSLTLERQCSRVVCRNKLLAPVFGSLEMMLCCLGFVMSRAHDSGGVEVFLITRR